MHHKLLARLEAAPDDTSTYLVYADELQSAGDPQGELIALHHAHLLAPAGTSEHAAMSGRIEQLMSDHGATWFGELSKRYRKRLRLDWHLGFVRAASFEAKSVEDARAMLERLLKLHIARVLCSLTVRFDRGAELDLYPVWECLLAAGKPRTLRELRIGQPAQGRIPDSLYEVFDNLGLRPEAQWAEILQRIDKQKRLGSGFCSERLPELIRKDDTLDIAYKPERLLVGLRAELDKKRDIGLVAGLRRLYTAESLDRLTRHLLLAWEREGTPSARRWVLDAAGVLGGETTSAYLAGRLDTWSHQRAVQATERLVQIGAPMGINEIFELTWADGARAEHAALALHAMAKKRGVSSLALLDRAVPQSMNIREHARFLRIQRRWFEQLMVDGHRLSSADFRHYVAAGPRHPAAAGLVWGAFVGQICTPFRIAPIDDAERAFLDVSGAPFTLPEGCVIGVPHPLELSAEQRQAWSAHLRERAIEQLFPQIRRPTFALSQDDRRRETSFRFMRRVAGDIDSLSDPGRWRRWESYNIDRDVTTYGSQVRLARGRQAVEAVIVHTFDGQLDRLFVRGGRRLGDVHPIIMSEILHDVEEQCVLPMTDGFPIVEAAPILPKPSTCVVCEQPIERRTARVGLQRARGTGARREVATVWVHWRCREQSPELLFASRTRDLAPELAHQRSQLRFVKQDRSARKQRKRARKARQKRAAARPGLSESQVLALCPDTRARTASLGITDPDTWPLRGHDGKLAWGECLGSRRYRVVLDLGSLTFTCDCPSRKRPCKHSIALALLYVRDHLQSGPAPQWALDRRP